VLDRLADADRALFYWINRDQQNAVFDRLMPFVTDLDNFRVGFVLLFVALLVFGKSRARAAALLVIPLLAISDQLSSNLLKDAFDRVRPCGALPDVRLLVGCSDSFSMPSSHAANAGAAAIHFLLFYRRLWVPLGLAALAVGYSRVYVGVHYPGDVLAGFLVGLAAALAVQGIHRGVPQVHRGAGLRSGGTTAVPGAPGSPPRS
jgi:undecaprenyl-diphosphatase